MRPPIVSTSSASPIVVRFRVDRRRDILETGPRVDDETAVGGAIDLRAFVQIVLIFDIANNHLDDILDRSETLRAAIFVDDQRHVSARRLHLHQQIEGGHRGRNKQDRAQNIGLGQGKI